MSKIEGIYKGVGYGEGNDYFHLFIVGEELYCLFRDGLVVICLTHKTVDKSVEIIKEKLV